MIENLLAALQASSPEMVLVMMLITAFAGVLIMLRLFGEAGLYVYIALAIIAANIQVQKVVQFGFYLEPVALGTVLFSTSYLATDMLSEFFGSKAARRGVLVGFVASLFWVVIMVLTVGYSPLTPEQAGDTHVWALGTHDHLAALFTPFPSFFLASIIAYLCSQYFDVWVYKTIRKITNNKALWLRNILSTALSGLLDNAIFSTLAFVVLTVDPVPLNSLIWVFILGTYAMRVAIAVLDTPTIYLARHLLPADYAARQ